jgi:hypothetical protein
MLKAKELLYSALAMVVITFFYLLVQTTTREIPSASSLWGHGIGILGFLLMVMTETLYSIRKRSKRGANWGKMSNWLEFHIFTGIVGPFMVLLHPGFQFQGLAGVLSLMTVLMVFSGFFGRYIYTAIPRSDNGAEISLQELELNARLLEVEIAKIGQAGQTVPIKKADTNSGSIGNLLFRFGSDILGFFQDFGNQMHKNDPARQKAIELTRIRRRYNQLQRQINNLNVARRMFSLWHTIHIPIGLTLFSVALIHIGAAIYYAILL